MKPIPPPSAEDVSQQLEAVFERHLEPALARLEPGRRVPLAQRIWLRRLVQSDPELRAPDATSRLAAAVVAVVAQSKEEATVIREAFERGYRSPERGSEAGSDGASVRRWVWGALLVCVTVVALGLFWPPDDTSGKTSTSKDETTSAVVETPKPKSRWVLRPVPTATRAVEVTRLPPAHPFLGEPVSAALGLTFVGLGLSLMLARRRFEDEEADQEPEIDTSPETLRRHEENYVEALGRYEEKLLQTPRAPQRVIARVQSFAPEALLESAGLLGRLRTPLKGRDLDVDTTVRATADAGGMFRPVLRPAERPGALLVCVDVESNDHVWLGMVRRVLLDWERLGVPLEVFEYKYAPEWLDPIDGPRRPLQAVLRDQPDRPLLIASRRLDRDVAHYDVPAWLSTLVRDRTAAWLDLEPEAPTGERARLVQAFGRLGLRRFPFTARGLVALGHYIVSEGQHVVQVPNLELPPVDAPELQADLRRWALAAALVPEATWDDIETVRRDPRLSARFGTRAHAQLLLRWVAGHLPGGATRDLGAGRELDVDREVINAWIREAQARDPGWEARWRRHWLRQEEDAPLPEDELERLRRTLRIARHRYHLGEGTKADMAQLRGTLVHPEAVRDLEQARDLPRRPSPPSRRTPSDRLRGPRPLILGAACGVACGVLSFGGRAPAVVHVFEVPEKTTVTLYPGEFAVERVAAIPMVRIEAQEFWMGSPKDEAGRDGDETRHRVRLTQPFLLAATEVTQGQWRAVMGTQPSYFRGNDDRPVERVSWFDAVAFLNQLSEAEGLSACYRPEGCEGTPGGGCVKGDRVCASDYTCRRVARVDGCRGYRLPTEAEWEAAARGGRPAPSSLETVAVFDSSQTASVASKAAHPAGLFDMLGNVWEWVEDDYEAYPTTPDVLVDPLTYDPSGRNPVSRGCGFNSGPAYCRAAQRFGGDRARRYLVLGFRPARSGALDP